MRNHAVFGATAVAALIASPAMAQGTPATPEDPAIRDDGFGDIVVTAQRQSQRLRDVPIAVSAFTGEALQAQQIDNALDLQLSLPNITFTKTNFTTSSFTIRGIGDLCTGFSCDTATGIHVNDMPLLATRLFEIEYYDLERLEVLRGPQGTLFGRNATSGVVNFITARPDLTAIAASGSFEYGNYDSRKISGMINLPVGETLGLRLAGYYLNRDGYTKNQFDGGRIDGRDLYSLRGTLRFEPSASTTIDLIGFYFREKDDRSRIQKQLCHRDPTGILGCAPDRLANEISNGNATIAAILSSREFFRLNNAALTNFGLGSVYGADVFFGGQTVPADKRTVNTDFNPSYFAEEIHAMARIEQQLGEKFNLTVTGGWTKTTVDSRTDYNLAAGNSLAGNTGMATLFATSRAPGALFPGGVNPYTQAVAALMPNGPSGGLCTSEVNTGFTGIYGGFVNRCTAGSTDYDRSQSIARQYLVEAHIDSKLDGPFNFLLGGIYVDQKSTDGNYYVASYGLDYAAGVLGAATALGQRAAGNTAFPNVFIGPPFYDSETNLFTLKSYGLFGEAYFQASERLKFTAGIRYSNDRKVVRARVPLLSFPVPFGLTDANGSPLIGSYDADPSRTGVQSYDEKIARFDEFTGRAVIDYRITDDNLLYASYARGYKSGGINPPLDPQFSVPRTFVPEIVNALEIGLKNTLLDGTLRLNLSAFYYQYQDLQLSRIVARTSVNDNTDADIYGVEAEAVIRPDPSVLVTLSASYLHSRIKNKMLVDPRDVAGGRSDTVIIKDLTNASNCVVQPNSAGNAAGANTLVAAINGGIGLAAPVPVPGTSTTGAYSVCAALAATIANPPAPLRALFATPTGALPFTVSQGVEVDLAGKQLPNAPRYKFSAGFQYTADFANGMSLVPRLDLAYTGNTYGRSFNRPIDRIQGYAQVNAQIQLNARNDRWFARAFVSNLFDSNATTGEYVTDQTSGLFTNIFTLEPRRYGAAIGFSF